LCCLAAAKLFVKLSMTDEAAIGVVGMGYSSLAADVDALMVY
jgi:hypothetical protein